MDSSWDSGGGRRLLAALLIGLMPACPALAQSASDAPAPEAAPPPPAQAGEEGSGLQEIVVTATRRSEPLSKVPISVSAFSQESLDARGVKDITDLVRFTPGVQLDANGTNNISIRGISSSAGAGTTGIYIDDTPIQMRALSFYSDDALPKTFELERVEVLRGPQGTLFGAGAEGGAVRYIMTQPSLRQTSVYSRDELSFTEGGGASYEAGVAYGAPIIDDELGFRASLWFRRDAGWIDRIDPTTHNTVQKNANFSNDVAGRLAVKWAVADDVTVTPSLLYQALVANDVTAYWPVFSSPGSDSYRNSDADRLGEPDRYFLPALKIEAGLGGVSLISNTSYFHRTNVDGYDGTIYNLSYYQTFNNPTNPIYLPMVNPGNYPLIDGNGVHLPPGLQNYRAPASVSNQLQTFTQEVRLQSDDRDAKWVWTAGLFYSVNRQSSVEAINDPMLNSLFQTLFGPGVTALSVFGEDVLANGDSFYSYSSSRDRQLAAYGEVTYALTDRLKATAGLRVSTVQVSFNNFADGPQNFGPSGGPGSQHEKPVTPKASLEYQANPDNMFYATYAKGYRIGGASPPVPLSACALDLANLGLSAPPGSYKSDKADSYELGAKNKLFDRLRIASSIYYIQWHNIQQIVYLPNCGFQFTSNLGNAGVKGGDIQLEYVPVAPLSIDLAVGRTDARYTSDTGTPAHLIAASGDAVEGASVTPAPLWTVALGIQYDFPAFDRKSFVRIDYEFQGRNGDRTATEDPRTATFDPLAFTPASTSYFSLRAGTVIGKWTVTGFIDNLFDTHPEFPPSADPHTLVDPYNPTPPSAVIRRKTRWNTTVPTAGSMA